ncbi:hypothetical protein [Hyphomicrobium sp.]|uniref:hypothetical protein n=1 Tax=Hyphomicrobium sp. TaxID=82 RepID=UPI002E3522EC|nr:hypothetical protein [Hyphomicrobium sp.]HEX2839802.1 hypothetical protein [Hyphomicrobium sp.]
MRPLSRWIWPTLIFVVFCALAALFDPVFQTNDDAALAMLGSGFGIASRPEPQLIFSNLLYGHLVGAASWVLSSTAHAWLTTLMLAGAAATIMATAVQRSADLVPVGLLAAVGICLTAIMNPQYTTTAAALCVSAAVAANEYVATASRRWLAVALSLLLVSVILRWESAAMLAFAALPALMIGLLSSEGTYRNRTIKILSAGVALTVVVLAVDAISYAIDPTWKEVRSYLRVRALFNDFQSVPWVEGSDAYAKAGWSRNDYLLFKAWYARDPLFSFDNIKMIASAHAFHNSRSGLGLYLVRSWMILSTSSIALLTVSLSLLASIAAARASARIYVVGGLLGAGGAFLLVFLGGRPPLERISLSLIVFLAGLAYVLMLNSRPPLPVRRWAKVGLGATSAYLLALNAMHASYDRSIAHEYTRAFAHVQRDLTDRTIVWGSAVDANYLMSLWGNAPFLSDRKFVGIGAATRAPYVDEILKTWGVTDFSRSLCTDRTISILARKDNIDLFQHFCRARYNAGATYKLVAEKSPFKVWRLEGGLSPPG